ncbi:MAG: hypothetical protein BIFFINMI_00202 [Phycisphaerae bacterium]|nr:hypothetical protein [Phycisphaerae bacterium]
MRPPNDNLAAALAERIGDRAILDVVESVYAELADVVAREQPLCRRSGRCCNFAAWGHRLYVTTPELVYFLSGWPAVAASAASAFPGGPIAPPADPADAALPDACPLQSGGLCTVHAIRPLGCRIFYCQQGWDRCSRPLYERLQGRLQDACRTCSLPYAYVEWRASLILLFKRGLISPSPTRR